MRDAIWIPCYGEAHSNWYQDHCGCCTPWWGVFPVCPDCLLTTRRVGSSRAPGVIKTRCVNSACASYRRWFTLPERPGEDAWGRFALMWSAIAREVTRG